MILLSGPAAQALKRVAPKMATGHPSYSIGQVLDFSFRQDGEVDGMAATVTLPVLLALFKIDRDLQHLKSGLENAQKEQKNQQNKIALLQKEHDTQDLAHKKLQADISTRDMEMKTRQEHI